MLPFPVNAIVDISGGLKTAVYDTKNRLIGTILPNGDYQSLGNLSPIIKRPGNVARSVTSVIGAGGWNKNGDASFTLTDSPNSFNNNSAIRLTNVTGSDSFAKIRSVVALDAIGVSGKIEIPVFIPANLAVGATITATVSSDASSNPPTADPTNSHNFIFQPSQFKRGQWQFLTVDFNATSTTTPNPVDGTLVTVLGTGADLTNIKQIQLYCYIPASGSDKYLDIGPISFGTLATPSVILCFDGAGADLTHFAYVLPALAKYGFTANFSIQGQNIPSNVNAIKKLLNAGMEISNEGLNHTNYLNNPSTFTADISTNTANFDALSLGVDFYKKIYTAAQNALSVSQIQQLVTAGYKLIRAGTRCLTPVSNLGFEPSTPFGSYATSAKTGAQLITMLDTIELHGESTLMTFHSIPNITAGSATGTDVALPDFLAFINELGLRIGQGRIIQSSCLNYVERANSPLAALGQI